MSEVYSFDPSWTWLDRPPLHLESGLAGHAVVVLHWRLGCVHSRAALLELSLLARDQHESYSDTLPLAVVAVHWPTFAAERDVDRLRRVVAELPSPIAVAMAPGCVLTGVVATQAQGGDGHGFDRLPTMKLLDGKQVVRASGVGVPRRARLRAALDYLRGERSRRDSSPPVRFVPSRALQSSRWLPTAVACDGDRVWVATSNPGRVLAFDRDGKLVMTVGNGQWGCEDGAADHASFALPHALVVHEGHLAVADVGSHSIRAIDRETGDVLTWCGAGLLGTDPVGGSYGRDQALSSPGGLVSRDSGLFVCNAGTDQIWQVDPMTGAAMSWLGGEHGADHGWHDATVNEGFTARGEHSFGEPLGMASVDDELWVTEGRSHALAKVDMAHVERSTMDANWLRPTGVAVHQERVFVCDSWRGEIVAVHTQTGARERCLGREHGLVEPVSLAIEQDCMYVVDRGARAVFVVDLQQELLVLERWQSGDGFDSVLEPAVESPASEAPVIAARIAEACCLREHTDVELRIPTPTHEAGTVVVLDVVDEATPLLATARRRVTESVVDGFVTILLPIADPGEGALRVRLRIDEATWHYVLPATVDAKGELRVELRFC